MWKWEITHIHDGLSIKEFLFDIARLSKRLLIKAKSAEGKIMVNGHQETVRYQLKQGDILHVVFPEEIPAMGLQKENIPLQIVYEDDAILLLNKPASIATIPSNHHPNGTIANGVLYHYFENNIQATVHVVTRLDKDTSGLLLIAKHQYSHSLLSNLQRKNQIVRKYTAIVSGRIKGDSGVINNPIGRKEGSIIERVVKEDGQHAVTHYVVMERLNNATMVEVTLETGRTHQIRVHFSSIGHPLLGDNLYGGNKDLLCRQALHCSTLSFQHPFTDERMNFTLPLPNDMDKLLSIL